MIETRTTMLGGDAVEVLTPDPGVTGPELVDAIDTIVKEAEQLVGLDVESTYMTELAQFDPAFRVRTVQLASPDTAIVLRLDDELQHAAARDVLANEAISFASHSNMDVLSVWAAFRIDITDRNIDTLSLARMVYTDKDRDRDLKALSVEHGMPELKAADDALLVRFKELWPGKKNAKKSDIEAFGFETIAVDDPLFTLYGGLDAISARRLAPILAALTEAPVELLRVESFLASRANKIQIRGCRVDQEMLETTFEETNTSTEAAKARFADLTGVNAQSPAKVNEWFAEHGARWDEWAGARTPTGAPSLAKENVRLLLDFDLNDKALQATAELIEFKSQLDLRNKTKALRERVDAHGFIHPVLHPMGASTTARMSSGRVQYAELLEERSSHAWSVPSPGWFYVRDD